jgi:hypothetical protein
MNNRARAISVLQQARDVLANRLSERILEARQEIIDDAEGTSYLSEIEAIYDQLGGRLAHVTTMLSNLPPSEDAGGVEVASGEPIYSDVATAQPGHSDAAGALGPLALPSPAIAAEVSPPAAAPITFQMFAAQIHTGDLEGAGRSLAALFDVDVARGRRCAEVFYQHLASNPDLPSKAMRLRVELIAGSVNGALMLLWECFGLTGVESLGVVQTLKARLAAVSD